jgi:hypothetical protein
LLQGPCVCEEHTAQIALTANDRYVLHGPGLRTTKPETVEFPVPEVATKGGTLNLKWTVPEGLGGGGRNVQVAEVWLLCRDCH